MGNPKKTALVHHQPLMLESLIRIFGAIGSLSLVDSSLPCPATAEILARGKPDVVLLGADDPDLVVKTVEELAKTAPDIKIIVFASPQDTALAVKVLETGAAGYVSSCSTAEEIVEAVMSVLEGNTFISPKIATKVILSLRTSAIRKAHARKRNLNVREEQIVELLLKGRTNKQIARSLTLSEHTVKHYMHHLMQKLEAKNRLELALRYGLPNKQKLGPASATEASGYVG